MSKVEIQILAEVTQANARLQQLETRMHGMKSSTGGLSAGLKEAGLALGAIVGAAYAANKAFDATVGAVIDYNKSILDASKATGTTAEQFSRIVQVADDVGISMGSVETALALATKNGFAPSVDSLADLADKLNAMSSPTERAAAAAKIFGRNWAALDPLLQKGGQAIREASAAVEDGLVVTDAEIAKTEEARLAIDKLSDTWTSLKNTVGLEAVPTITKSLINLNDVLSGNITYLEGMRRGWEGWFTMMGLNQWAVSAQTKILAADMKELARDMRDSGQAAGELETAVEALPTQKSFKYNMSIDMDSDMQELIRHMGWSAAAYLFAGGQGFNIGAAGNTAIAQAGAASFGAAQAAKKITQPLVALTGGQHGGSFIVPGSGSGDRPYTLGLEPGERVDITPRSEVNNSRNLTMGNVSINNGMDQSGFQSMLRRALGGE
jgi:hypothetical protein